MPSRIWSLGDGPSHGVSFLCSRSVRSGSNRLLEIGSRPYASVSGSSAGGYLGLGLLRPELPRLRLFGRSYLGLRLLRPEPTSGTPASAATLFFGRRILRSIGSDVRGELRPSRLRQRRLRQPRGRGPAPARPRGPARRPGARRGEPTDRRRSCEAAPGAARPAACNGAAKAPAKPSHQPRRSDGRSASFEKSWSLERGPADHASLHDQRRVGPGKVAQRLGRRADLAVDEGDRGRAAQEFGQTLVLAAGRWPGGPGVLVNLVVAEPSRGSCGARANW